MAPAAAPAITTANLCISSFMNMPQIKVISAQHSAAMAKALLKSAIRDDNPVLFLHSLSLGGKRGEVPAEEYLIPIGERRYQARGQRCHDLRSRPSCVYRPGRRRRLCRAAGIAGRSDRPAQPVALGQGDGLARASPRPGVSSPSTRASQPAAPPANGRRQWRKTLFTNCKAPVQRVTNKDVPMPFSPVLGEGGPPVRGRCDCGGTAKLWT